jgi:hypothetical protein
VVVENSAASGGSILKRAIIHPLGLNIPAGGIEPVKSAA